MSQFEKTANEQLNFAFVKPVLSSNWGEVIFSKTVQLYLWIFLTWTFRFIFVKNFSFLAESYPSILIDSSKLKLNGISRFAKLSKNL